MKFAMILLDRVIDIVESNNQPTYPPDQNGNPICAKKCDETVQIGDEVVDGVIIGTLALAKEESQQELLMQSLTDLELQNLEAQQERQLLAQQVSDLELAILEGGASNV